MGRGLFLGAYLPANLREKNPPKPEIFSNIGGNFGSRCKRVFMSLITASFAAFFLCPDP